MAKAKKTKKPPSEFSILRGLIAQYGEAKVNQSWAGSEHPFRRPIIEAEFNFALAKLNSHIDKMEEQKACCSCPKE